MYTILMLALTLVVQNPETTLQEVRDGTYPVTPATVIVRKPIADSILTRYDNDALEFLFCLGGEVRGDSLILNKLVEPAYVQRDSSSLSMGRCPPDALADIHSHPQQKPGRWASMNTCGFSVPDQFSFKNNMAFNGRHYWVTLVVCHRRSIVKIIHLSWAGLREQELRYGYHTVMTGYEWCMDHEQACALPRAVWPSEGG